MMYQGCQCTRCTTCQCGPCKIDGVWRECGVCERDKARAEVERLRAEVDRLRYERRMFRRRIKECLPWVGCTPYPNTPGFSEMIACRDLAKDTLEEVPE